eukprot:664464-Pyramimonas_sp.AAC.1
MRGLDPILPLQTRLYDHVCEYLRIRRKPIRAKSRRTSSSSSNSQGNWTRRDKKSSSSGQARLAVLIYALTRFAHNREIFRVVTGPAVVRFKGQSNEKAPPESAHAPLGRWPSSGTKLVSQLRPQTYM